MESVNRTIWDEWGAMPSNEQARDEAAGILDGLPSRARGEEIMFISPRLFAVRRLMRLWGECCSCPADGQQGIRLVDTQIKGKIVFAADKERTADILSVTRSTAKRTRNWGWVRGIFGSCGALYMPKAGYYLIMRPQTANGSAERLQAILKSCGFTVGVRKRATYRELTLRDQQQIVTLLSRMGLVKTALSLEETAIYRSMRRQHQQERRSGARTDGADTPHGRAGHNGNAPGTAFRARRGEKTKSEHIFERTWPNFTETN